MPLNEIVMLVFILAMFAILAYILTRVKDK